jgi:transcriptional regulator with XRE-family HTH domain
MDLPDQEELRRRLRAARALRDLSVVDVAERMPREAKLSLSTLRKIETGERRLDPVVLHELAARIGVPYAWFTVPDVAQAVLGSGGDSLEDRLLALESAQVAIARDLAEIRNQPGGPGAVRHTPPRESRAPTH